jgi:putative inorganic carbon (hco3(-)) transporter
VRAERAILPAGLAVACVAALVALASAGAVSSGTDEVFIGAVALAACGAILYLALTVEPAWPLSLGIGLSIFSGYWDRMGFPIGPDRLLVAAGILGVVLAGLPDEYGRARRGPLRWETAHWLLFAALLWAIASAASAGTLTEPTGFFALLDRFGLVPFLAFLVAPVAFRTERQRTILLATLIVTGAYLGLTALLEGLGLDAFVFPSYISDPAVGIHADRARGPFVQAVAMGLGLFVCGGAAALGLARLRGRPWLRAGSAAVAALCALGIVLTLTRAIWLGAVVAAVVVFFAVPRLWRAAPVVAIACALLVVGALAVVPGLRTNAEARSGADSPVWVRENTNRAALRMIAAHPLTGVGWERFKEENPRWIEQQPDIPMAGVIEGVHNVFLANASELGLPGTFLWLAGAVLGIGGALVRRVSPQVRPWQILLLGVTIMVVVAGSLGPLPYAFPLLALWTLAGAVGAGAVGWPPSRSGAASKVEAERL